MSSRTRARTWSAAAPIACGCALAAAAAYVAIADPNATGTHLPACPFHTMTGLWCPGCGLTRATHALLRGHIATAFGDNIFFPVFLGAIIVAWLEWASTAVRSRPLGWFVRLPRWAPAAFGVTLLVFGVIRNVPAFHVLAP
jgi:hypothetical protein